MRLVSGLVEGSKWVELPVLGGQLILEVINFNVIWTTAPIMYKPITHEHVQTCIDHKKGDTIGHYLEGFQ